MRLSALCLTASLLALAACTTTAAAPPAGTGLAEPAASREDLMDKARRLWRWHKEITHGHS